MILNKDDVNLILNKFSKKNEITGYAIKINGKFFRTDKAKMLWNNKSSASLALRNALEVWVLVEIKIKLANLGYSETEINNHDEYKNAWTNFRKYLEENKLIEFVEFKNIYNKNV